MSLLLKIISPCNKADSIEFFSEGWPILEYIGEELNHWPECEGGTTHLQYNELLDLAVFLVKFESKGEEFVGDRWNGLSNMIDSCKNCGVDIFASW